MNHNYNEMLVDFVERKDEIVLNQVGLHYIDGRDVQSILKWNSEDAEFVFDSIKAYIELLGKYQGCLCKYTCPWCIYQRSIRFESCTNCEYAKNHGECEYNPIFNRGGRATFNYVKILSEIEDNSFLRSEVNHR